MNVLCAVDYNGKFIYMNVGYPSTVNDSAIFRASALNRDIQTGATFIGPDFRIIGDSAFAASDFMIRSTEEIGSANARTIVENSFGQIKQKYRYMESRIETDVDEVPYFIKTCAILFNINKEMQED